ncbi:MAG: NAD-dependent epimerase/dehydratase family protein, partial [Chloroflexota bacterium]
MTRVLVTGAAGYLGSVLCEHLLDANFRVTAIDNLMYAQQSLFHLCINPWFEFVFGDVRDQEILSGLIKQTDVL